MSTLAAWSYTSTLTIWPVTMSNIGGQSFGAPYTIKGSWESGGDTQTNADGDQFVPASTYYFEAEEGSPLIPERLWYIAIGDLTANPEPPKSAERIKKVGGWDASAFGPTEIPDRVIYT